MIHRANIDKALNDDRRGDDGGASGVLPDQRALAGVKAVDVAIDGAKVDAPAFDAWRGGNLGACLILPGQPPGLDLQGIEEAINPTEKTRVRPRRARSSHSGRYESARQASRLGVEGVEVLIKRADEDQALGEGG